MTAQPEVLGRFELALDAAIRVCAERDLVPLEWFGLFTEHRNIIRATFEAQKQGRSLMLVADRNGYPIGQAWIDFTKERARASAVFWAIRVLPALCRAGIGTRLVLAAGAPQSAAGLLMRAWTSKGRIGTRGGSTNALVTA